MLETFLQSKSIKFFFANKIIKSKKKKKCENIKSKHKRVQKKKQFQQLHKNTHHAFRRVTIFSLSILQLINFNISKLIYFHIYIPVVFTQHPTITKMRRYGNEPKTEREDQWIYFYYRYVIKKKKRTNQH